MNSIIYVIAEIGNSHEGSLGLAKKFIETVKETGADAVKLQTHIFEFESVKNAPKPYYFKDESREDYFNRTSFSLKDWEELFSFSKSIGLDFISSPFSIEAFDMLEKINIDGYKIASGEITNIPLIEKISKSNKKIFISSGMSSNKEISAAVKILTQNNADFVIMQCTSIYPCPPEKSGLNIISQFIKDFGSNNVGLSDHTEGIGVSLASIAIGARYLEKHFTLSKKMYGSDAKFSLEPHEFKVMVDEIRNIEKSLNNPVDKDLISIELTEMKHTFEKSLVYISSLKKGQRLGAKDIGYKKPGNGIPSGDINKVIGRILKKAIKTDEQINHNDFE